MVLVVKAVVGLGLLGGLAFAAWGPAPRRAAARIEVRRLLAGVAALYGAAAAAALMHRGWMAEAACAAGVALGALAGWLSRDAGGGGGDADDGDQTPGDDGGTPIDWDRFDRARRAWDRPRERTGR